MLSLCVIIAKNSSDYIFINNNLYKPECITQWKTKNPTESGDKESFLVFAGNKLKKN